MKNRTKNIIDILSALLICLFVYAAEAKLIQYSLFVEQLMMHPLFRHFAESLAWILPVTELIVAVLLIFPFTRMAGFYASAILLLIFTIYLTGMILTDKHLPCSCGGIISGFGWGQHIVFNLFFIVVSITGIVLIKNRNSSAKPSIMTV